MIFCSYVTIILVILTLMLQSVGMTLLIHWFRAQFPEGIHELGVFRSVVLVVRFTGLLICLHISEILLWAIFFGGSVLRPGNPRSIFRREAILRLVVGIFFSP